MPALTDEFSVAGWLKTYASDADFNAFVDALCSDCSDPDMRVTFMREMSQSWEFWARPDQWTPPDGDLPEDSPHKRPAGGPHHWRTWLIMSGRGAGKTRTGAEWITEQAIAIPNGRFALIGETAADTRDVMIGGDSGIIACAPDNFRPTYNPSIRRLTWPNGAQALTFSGDVPDQLRGPQFHAAWVDELAKFRYAKLAWDNLQMGLRLGQMPRCLITTTPRPLALLKTIMASPATVLTRVSTFANATNLPETFFDALKEQYEGSRIAAQELYGQIIEDIDGALWTFETIAGNRLKIGEETPDLDIIAVGVDPSGSKEGDECGIVAAGATGKHAYVLGDWSMQASTGKWARKAVLIYHQLQADVIVVEDNYGGEMTEYTLRAAAKELHAEGEIETAEIHIRRVRGSSGQGKVARAMPVSQAYEQGRVHHVGEFIKLEAEMRNFTAQWNRNKDKSPNRVDALVYAVRQVLDKPSPRRSMVFGSVSLGA